MGLADSGLRVFICDPDHPHYGESGYFTGHVIVMRFGPGHEMAELALDNCKHGTRGCFVSKGQVRIEKRRATS